jgi:hypothetical protein
MNREGFKVFLLQFKRGLPSRHELEGGSGSSDTWLLP